MKKKETQGRVEAQSSSSSSSAAVGSRSTVGDPREKVVEISNGGAQGAREAIDDRIKTAAESLLDDPVVRDVVVEAAAQRANARVAAREEKRVAAQQRAARRTTILTGVGAAVLSAFGYVGLQGMVAAEVSAGESRLAGIASDKAQVAMTKQVDARVESKVNEVRAEFQRLSEEVRLRGAYQLLSHTVLALQQNDDHFTRAERDEAVDLLRQIAVSDELRRRPGFVGNLETIIDKWSAAGQPIDELFDLYRNEALASGGIVETLIQHYGRELAGDSQDPSRWDPKDVERFGAVEAAAEAHQLDELSRLYRSLIEFRRSGDKRCAVGTHWMSCLASPEGAEQHVLTARARIVTQLAAYTHSSFWMRTKTPEAAQLEQTARAFIRAHREDLADLSFDAVTKAIVLPKAAGTMGCRAELDAVLDGDFEPLLAYAEKLDKL